MDFNEIDGYSGKYFAATDFAGNGAQRFKVVAWEVVKFKDNSQKIALELEDETRRIVLNKTNARNLAQGVGSNNTDDWLGTTIEVCAIDGMFAGKPVKALRVTVVPAADGNTPF